MRIYQSRSGGFSIQIDQPAAWPCKLPDSFIAAKPDNFPFPDRNRTEDVIQTVNSYYLSIIQDHGLLGPARERKQRQPWHIPTPIQETPKYIGRITNYNLFYMKSSQTVVCAKPTAFFKSGARFYRVKSSSRYFGSGHISLSITISNLSIWDLIEVKYGRTFSS